MRDSVVWRAVQNLDSSQGAASFLVGFVVMVVVGLIAVVFTNSGGRKAH